MSLAPFLYTNYVLYRSVCFKRKRRSCIVSGQIRKGVDLILQTNSRSHRSLFILGLGLFVFVGHLGGKVVSGEKLVRSTSQNIINNITREHLPNVADVANLVLYQNRDIVGDSKGNLQANQLESTCKGVKKRVYHTDLERGVALANSLRYFVESKTLAGAFK